MLCEISFGDWTAAGATVGVWLLGLSIGLLCVGGILISCFSFSGTWLIVLASILTGVARHEWAPWWWIVASFVAVATLVEVMESLAGAWGVTRRGGSMKSGLAALAGGIVGLFLGAWIPIPVIGPLVGLLIGTFGAVYMLERHRLQDAPGAAYIARGAVLARVGAILMKLLATVAMTAGLICAMLLAK
jgi:uncharacterized protein YqgC (DUF456 family)